MPTTRKKTAPSSVDSAKTISVAEAKARFSSIITRVETKRDAITILKRGVPVAQVIPIGETRVPLFGSMRGTARELGDIVGPTGTEWNVKNE